MAILYHYSDDYLKIIGSHCPHSFPENLLFGEEQLLYHIVMHPVMRQDALYSTVVEVIEDVTGPGQTFWVSTGNSLSGRQK